MLNPRYPAAVVAGNVETSQCITDALYGALGALAAAQGTMNNFTFGNARYQYYETMCGGSARGRFRRRRRGAHPHDQHAAHRCRGAGMALPGAGRELRIRRGSGGRGAWHGGDGIVRRIRFLEAMTAMILSKPTAGGTIRHGRRIAGRARHRLGRARRRPPPGNLRHHHQVQMNAGDVFVIQTPGGGGYDDIRGIS